MNDVGPKSHEQTVGALTKQLMQQTQALVETELQRLRLEGELRAEHAQKFAISLAVLVPLLTLLLGTLGAALVLWVSVYVSLLSACLIVAGTYLLLTVVVVWRMKRAAARILEPAAVLADLPESEPTLEARVNQPRLESLNPEAKLSTL